MKPAGRWASAVLLPMAAFLLYLAHNTSRTMLFRLDDPYGESGDAQSYWLAASAIGVSGILLSGALSLVTGPRLLLVISSLLTGASMMAAGVLGEHGARFAMYGVALGMGMTSVALYGAAAQAFERERAHLRDAVCVLIYAMVNASTFFGVIIEHVDSAAGARVFMLFGGGAALLAATLAGALALIVYKNRDPDVVKRALRPAHLGTVIGLGLVLGLVWSTTSGGFRLSFALYEEWPRLAIYLDPSACVAFGLVMALVFGLLRVFRKRVPTLVFVGVGFVFGSMALGLLLAGTPDEEAGGYLEGSNFLLLSAGIVTLAGAQILAFPLLLSRLGGDLPERFSTLAIAVALLVPRLTGLAQSAMREPGEPASNTLAYVGVGACLVFGVALIGGAFPLRRLFDPPDDAPAEF